MNSPKIAVIGLGYVGLPLATLLASKYKVTGFDLDHNRIKEILAGSDSTHEIDAKTLKKVLNSSSRRIKGLHCTSKETLLNDCDYFIVTVPTPVDSKNKPDLSALLKASRMVGKIMKKRAVVIYESTVYPGATEEKCVPVLEQASGLKFNKDFFVGYSPERVNPGDRIHTINNIVKVTSGSTQEVANEVNSLYSSVISAGTYMAPSIKVAEAAKVIENSQRDINIAFVNELAKIFNLMAIDTNAVLEAAATKWNFLPFRPGLVGGHCIGVDPYYLAQRAQEFGYHPEIILAGRRMNDSMGNYVASEVVKLMLTADIKVKGSKILVLGITFKENCLDVRNSKTVDVIKSLQNYRTKIDIYDPWAKPEEVFHEYGLHTTKTIPEEKYDAIVLAVAHKEFLNLDLRNMLNDRGVLYDVKGILKCEVEGRL